MSIKFLNLDKISKIKDMFIKNDDDEYTFVCGRDDTDLKEDFISVDTAYTFDKNHGNEVKVVAPLEFNPNHNYLGDF